jgi:trimeric autotransporter adhesin
VHYGLSYSTVGGGYNNAATAGYSTVGGGYSNTASGNNSTVGGGNNPIQHQIISSTVGGG